MDDTKQLGVAAEEPDVDVMQTEPAAEREAMPLRDIIYNMKVVILLDSIYFTGQNEAGAMIGPLLVYLGVSKTIIGLLSGIGGLSLVGMLVAPFITRRFRYKKMLLFFSQLPALLPLLITGLLLIYYPHFAMSKSDLRVAIVVLTLMTMVLTGFVNLPHQEYVAACIPNTHRGRYTGYSLTIGGLLSIGGGLVSVWLIDHYPEPGGFGYCYLMGWAICQIGYSLALLGRETPTPVDKSPRAWSPGMFKAAWENRPWVKMMTTFAIEACLVGTAAFTLPFAIEKIGMPSSVGARTLIIMQIVRMLVSPFAGNIVDRVGARRVIPPMIVVEAMAYLVMVLYPHPISLYLSQGMHMFAAAAWSPAWNVLQFGLPKPEHRAGCYTLQGLIWSISYMLGATLSGVAIERFSYAPVFITVAVLGFMMCPFSKYMLSSCSDKSIDYS